MTEQTQRPKAFEIKFGPRYRIRDVATWVDAIRKNGIRDITAGCVASVVLIANIISFGALMFPGELSAGIPIAIWAMLIGGCLGGLFIALGTSLPPLATGIDSPTGAVLILLGAAVSREVLAEGGSTEAAIQTSMLLFSCSTFLSGASLYVLGHFKWGAYFRFVPYSVVAGFLAATGLFLILGGVRMAIGRSLTASPFGNWTITDATKLICAIATLGVLLALRRWIKSGVATPTALILMWLFGSLALQYLGVSEAQYGWYLPALGSLSAWQPLKAAQSTHLTSSQFLISLPELIAVVLVAIVSLVTKVSSLRLRDKFPEIWIENFALMVWEI
jgi:SulP family sulfate permease